MKPAPARRNLSVPLRTGKFVQLRDVAAQKRRSMAAEARAAIDAYLRDQLVGHGILPACPVFALDEGSGP